MPTTTPPVLWNTTLQWRKKWYSCAYVGNSSENFLVTQVRLLVPAQLLREMADAPHPLFSRWELYSGLLCCLSISLLLGIKSRALHEPVGCHCLTRSHISWLNAAALSLRLRLKQLVHRLFLNRWLQILIVKSFLIFAFNHWHVDILGYPYHCILNYW